MVKSIDKWRRKQDRLHVAQTESKTKNHGGYNWHLELSWDVTYEAFGR